MLAGLQLGQNEGVHRGWHPVGVGDFRHWRLFDGLERTSGRGGFCPNSPASAAPVTRGSGAPILTQASRSAIWCVGKLLVLGRHLQIRVGVAHRFDEQAVVGIAGDDGRAGFAALEQAVAGFHGEIAFEFFGLAAVAFVAIIDKDGPDVVSKNWSWPETGPPPGGEGEQGSRANRRRRGAGWRALTRERTNGTNGKMGRMDLKDGGRHGASLAEPGPPRGLMAASGADSFTP